MIWYLFALISHFWKYISLGQRNPQMHKNEWPAKQLVLLLFGWGSIRYLKLSLSYRHQHQLLTKKRWTPWWHQALPMFRTSFFELHRHGNGARTLPRCRGKGNSNEELRGKKRKQRLYVKMCHIKRKAIPHHSSCTKFRPWSFFPSEDINSREQHFWCSSFHLKEYRDTETLFAQ